MLIDTHAHINMLEDVDLAIKEAHEAGVSDIIIPSASEDDFETVIEIANKYDNVYAMLGVHPEECEKFTEDTMRKIIKLASNPKVVAIGEIGLDYHFTNENKEIQKRCFQAQVEIAKSLDLPISVHDRDAHFDTLEILKSQKIKKVLLHCYSGSVEFMQECCKLGYKIALGGVVTFKNAKEPKEVAKAVDIRNLMLETDSPYLTPHPFRGMENSPKYIGFVAKEIANLKNVSYDNVVLETEKNAKEFFNLK